MAAVIAGILVLALIVGAFALLARRLQQGEQPESTSWGKQFRRHKN